LVVPWCQDPSHLINVGILCTSSAMIPFLVDAVSGKLVCERLKWLMNARHLSGSNGCCGGWNTCRDHGPDPTDEREKTPASYHGGNMSVTMVEVTSSVTMIISSGQWVYFHPKCYRSPSFQLYACLICLQVPTSLLGSDPKT